MHWRWERTRPQGFPKTFLLRKSSVREFPLIVGGCSLLVTIQVTLRIKMVSEATVWAGCVPTLIALHRIWRATLACPYNAPSPDRLAKSSDQDTAKPCRE